VASSATRALGWRRVEERVTIPAEHDRLRFELSVTSPGSPWIDGVTIVPVVPDAERAAPARDS
jgi:hypothetical protein